MRRHLLLAPALFATLLSACSSSKLKAETPPGSPPPGSHQTVPLVGALQVQRYVLDNGLRLLVIEDHSSPTFAYQTWYRVGSRDEVPGRTGLAHLFEHLMFKGTKTHKDGDFEKILDSSGAEGNNAYTTHDYTVYVQELPSTKAPETGGDKLDLIAGVEADRMINLIVDEKIFRTELEVVQNERRMRNENSPDGLMYQELFSEAFTVHPYHWPVIGYQKDLEAMTAEDARQFYHAYYSPNHATVIITGDVKAEDAFKIVKKHYADIAPQDAPAHAVPPEPAQTAPRRKELPLQVQVERLLIGFHIPESISPEVPALDMIQGLLTGGNSSRLHRALVDTGIATDVSSDDLEDKDPTLFVFGVSLQKGKHAAQAEAVIARELKRLMNEDASEAELTRVRNRISFGFYSGFDTNSERARYVGLFETIDNDFELGIDQYKKVLAVTPAQIRAAAAKYLVPNNRTVITGVPK